jgi:hypothetical protein
MELLLLQLVFVVAGNYKAKHKKDDIKIDTFSLTVLFFQEN